MNRDVLLADVVVVAHLLYVLFVLAGFLLIVIGGFLRWGWVKNRWFRVIHLLTITIVAFEAVLGIECPLTTLEHDMRAGSGVGEYEGSFIGHWAHELLFIEGEPWVFTVCYCIFGALVVLWLFLVPPRWRRVQGAAVS